MRLSLDGDISDGVLGPRALWKPATPAIHRQGYGRWLTFLIGQEAMTNKDEAPWERVTHEPVEANLAERSGRDMSSWTIWF